MKNIRKNKKLQSPNVPVWERRVSVGLQSLILLSGLYQLFFRDVSLGILILICWGFITLPAFFSRNLITKIPIEIQIVLFIMVFLQFVLGEARNFYTRVPYYDKFVHYFLPFFIGFIAFMIFFTMQATGRLKTTLLYMILLIILITLGIGAAWEILEYSSDVILYPRVEGWHHFQGNAQQDAITDTMTDLIVDTLGGIFGAILGVWFIGRLQNKNIQRFNEFVGEIAGNMIPGKGKRRK